MKSFSGRCVVLTGAASGIGRALAHQLASEGARLALVDVNEGQLIALAEELKAKDVVASAHQLDVRDRAGWAALAETVASTYGGCELLINNAGVTAAGGFGEMSEEDFDWVLDINLKGVIHGTRAFLPQLLKQEQGWIVNLSSMFGLVGVPSQVAYCTSKFAVRGFSEALAQELRPTNVGLTVVHPGGIATGIMKNARMEDLKNKARAERFFEKVGMNPAKAADIILGAVRRGRRRVMVGKDAQQADWIVRISPVGGMDRTVDMIVSTIGLKPKQLEG